jgi:hypothetical protein
MTEQDWLDCTDPEKMLEYLRGKASDRKLRLFAVACCRVLWKYLDDDTCRVVEIAESFAECQDDRSELLRASIWTYEEFCLSYGLQSLAVVWLATVDEGQPWPENAGEPDQHPRTIFEAALQVPRATLDAVASECFVDHPCPAGETVFSQRPQINTEGGVQRKHLAGIVRCIFGNPFHSVTLAPSWLTWHHGLLVSMARQMYESRDFTDMPSCERTTHRRDFPDNAS